MGDVRDELMMGKDGRLLAIEGSVDQVDLVSGLNVDPVAASTLLSVFVGV
jgi:hypothetical protein